MEFDYQKLVQEMMKQMQGSVAGISLKDFTDQYLAFTKSNRAKKTAEGVELVNKKLLHYFSPLRKVDTIGLKEAEQFLDALKKNAPKGVYNYNRVLRAMWNKAKQWNFIQENIFEKVKLPRRQKDEPVYFTDEQLAACLELLRKKGKDIIADTVDFLDASGMRPGEALNLRWTDFFTQKKVIVIGNSKFQVKNRRIRKIPLTDRMEEIVIRCEQRQLLNGKGKREFIFSQISGRQYQVDTISKTLKKIMRELELPEELHLYSCRATAATRWANGNVPIFVVSKMLGHSSTSVTQRFYAASDLEAMREAVNRL